MYIHRPHRGPSKGHRLVVAVTTGAWPLWLSPSRETQLGSTARPRAAARSRWPYRPSRVCLPKRRAWPMLCLSHRLGTPAQVAADVLEAAK